MGKTTVQKSGSRYVVTNRLIGTEELNIQIIHSIFSGVVSGFLPVNYETKKKERYLKCVVTGLLPMDEYLQNPVNRSMFFTLIRKVIAILRQCEINNMNANNIDLRFPHMFIEPRTKELFCIYWPVVNNQEESSPSQFFKELPDKLTFINMESRNYVDGYSRFLEMMNPFSIMALEKYLKNFDENGTGSSTPSELLRKESDYVDNRKVENKNIAYDPFSQPERKVVKEEKKERVVSKPQKAKFCPSCGYTIMPNARFCVSCGEKLKLEEISIENKESKEAEPQIEPQKEYKMKPEEWRSTEVIPQPDPNSYNGNISAVSGTTVLSYEETGGTTCLNSGEITYPYLIWEKTEEKILVDKPVFRIGKEREYCDFFVMNNSTVSRSHADIITDEGRYYIKDLGSTNGTYLDCRMIAPQNKVEIFSGTKIRLSNEDFIFYC